MPSDDGGDTGAFTADGMGDMSSMMVAPVASGTAIPGS